jgi:hypothetical protein
MKIPLILLGAVVLAAPAFAQPAPDAPKAAPAIGDPAPVPARTRYAAPEPQYQEVTESYNARVFLTGALVFAGSYSASVIVAAASSNDRGNDRLYVPVLGPWLALDERGPCDLTRSSCDHETTAKVLLAADGVFQAAGIIGMIDGVLQPPTRRVITRSAKLDTKLHLKPTAGPGLAVYGRF